MTTEGQIRSAATLVNRLRAQNAAVSVHQLGFLDHV
jgi:hypothetical protein